MSTAPPHPPSPSSPEPPSSSPPAPRKRSLRCPRCSVRKFRTPRDLALHILVKHGRVHVPPPDDACSVTLSSPLLPKDLAEIDHLLAAAQNDANPRIEHHHRHQQPLRRVSYARDYQPQPGKRNRQPLKRKQAPQQQRFNLQQSSPRHVISKQPWSCTTTTNTTSSPPNSHPHYMSNCHSPRRVHQLPSESMSSTDDLSRLLAPPSSPRKGKTTDGESTGPKAKDVYLARCRSGRIPLVPIQPANTSPAMLNFANGLF